MAPGPVECIPCRARPWTPWSRARDLDAHATHTVSSVANYRGYPQRVDTPHLAHSVVSDKAADRFNLFTADRALCFSPPRPPFPTVVVRKRKRNQPPFRFSSLLGQRAMGSSGRIFCDICLEPCKGVAGHGFYYIRQCGHFTCVRTPPFTAACRSARASPHSPSSTPRGCHDSLFTVAPFTCE